MSNHGYYGMEYDRTVENTNTSTLHKMKETYWTTKQAVIKKLGKKEDEHIVASDAQLDAKLEVFKAVQKSCMDLLRVIERYQDRLCALSQEENTMGRFLKSQSGHDKTRAGKMMAAVGKSQSFAAQQRLALRVPLVRLYQEVETFRYRAISDTLVTINRMEGARTEYRGALLWMKNVSEELDPDMYNRLEKFRKVQSQVRKTKSRFDKLKLDVMQKVDLLAASRCNMFSHVLANYQSTLLHFWEKTSRTMSAVAESFKGYQYYEFNMLKELAEPSKKLVEDAATRETPQKDTDDFDSAKLLDFESELADETSQEKKATSISQVTKEKNGQKAGEDEFGPFMDFDVEEDDSINPANEDFDFSGKILEAREKNKEMAKKGPTDLLTDDLEQDDADKDDMTLLNEILNAPSTGEDEFTQEWQAVFGLNQPPTSPTLLLAETDQPKTTAEFMPSSLLDLSSQMSTINIGQGEQAKIPIGAKEKSTLAAAGGASQQKQGKSKQQNPPKKGQKGDMSAWFNLFADLDPLSDPDAIGREEKPGAL
ncbi:islet cell autoantigen 1-like [Gigantopelta aegis]|uniref:islet cell autoantigen 1-like n=1 Tax=Gigantopelta aegis TaxID=1735272 RepID=UPI001B88919E|nr:islet cell autoantigen 1-like [Gigantopelta aegis]